MGEKPFPFPWMRYLFRGYPLLKLPFNFMSSSSPSDLLSPPPTPLELPSLNLESTIQSLSLYDFQLEASQPGHYLRKGLEKNPMLPGAILVESGKLYGMISRRRFLERLSRPYGLELFLKRPLKSLHRFTQTHVLSLPGHTLVIDAAKCAVQRPSDSLYEPIVVELAPYTYRLLDVHQLLIAQAQIHELAVELLNELYQELGTAHQELKRQACLDGLTQVANRRHFQEYLQQEWLQIGRQAAPISLILADVDYFKQYNDTYGHQAGDDCLRQVANAMKRAVKRSTDLVARYGGEEFAVILPYTDISGAIQVAEKIQQQIQTLGIVHEASSVNSYLTLSLGVASTLAEDDQTSEMLIAAADQALYQAKTSGRNRLVVRAGWG